MFICQLSQIQCLLILCEWACVVVATSVVGIEFQFMVCDALGEWSIVPDELHLVLLLDLGDA